jgi:hypothetical protein
VKRCFRNLGCIGVVVCAFLSNLATAQESFYERFRSNNASMAAVQPSWLGPVIQSDARLGQAMRLSVSNSSSSGAHTIDYGNGHGVSIILDRRFQLDFDPPSFFRNHSSASPDGFGNAGTQFKWRITSGNAEHGNYIVSAILWHGFSPGSQQNGCDSSSWKPTLAVGKALPHLALISNIGVLLPTANIAQQGRNLTWDTTAQIHPAAHLYFNLENNASFNRGGPFNGQIQNFVTPAAYFVLRRATWSPDHAILVFDSGLQTATSHFHQYNHNLVTEIRVFF